MSSDTIFKLYPRDDKDNLLHIYCLGRCALSADLGDIQDCAPQLEPFAVSVECWYTPFEGCGRAEESYKDVVSDQSIGGKRLWLRKQEYTGRKLTNPTASAVPVLHSSGSNTARR
jgi:hypothetical protein